uniref:Uncharacterized protein n=1 Tax=Avena sativa TaxID=4498 RepID=A0ACD6A5N3_AVESA
MDCINSPINTAGLSQCSCTPENYKSSSSDQSICDHPVVGMARGDKDDNSVRMHAEDFNAWLARMEAMDADELREYYRENKDVLSSQMKAAIKMVMQKKQLKKRKKRTAPQPILGAVLKFHKDDDDTPPPGPGGANAC